MECKLFRGQAALLFMQNFTDLPFELFEDVSRLHWSWKNAVLEEEFGKCSFRAIW